MDPIFLWWLTLGALIGFVLAWIWDWFWFRARRRVVSTEVDTQISTLAGERDKLTADLRACGDRRTALEGELKGVRADLATAQASAGELPGFRARVGELEGLNAQLRADLDAANTDLSAAQRWRARVGELEGLNAQLQTDLDAANAKLAAQTNVAAGAALGGTALGLAADASGNGGDSQLVSELRSYNLAMHDELDATRRTLARFAAGRGDPLIDIDGIGPVYQNKLYDAGVVSFDQLAAMHPDRVRSLVAPNALFELDTGDWIEQARRMAGRPLRDPLIDINGVGPVYEQRLLNAGVTTFQQLAGMSAAEIRAIINPEDWQNVDLESWIAEAKTLAAQVAAGTYRKGEY
jgi:predicted flap endonuclease-1-like 5' DNA nuclease